jgi:hypothetical protein
MDGVHALLSNKFMLEAGVVVQQMGQVIANVIQIVQSRCSVDVEILKAIWVHRLEVLSQIHREMHWLGFTLISLKMKFFELEYLRLNFKNVRVKVLQLLLMLTTPL